MRAARSFRDVLQSFVLVVNHAERLLIHAPAVALQPVATDSLGYQCLGYAPVQVVETLDDSGFDRVGP